MKRTYFFLELALFILVSCQSQPDGAQDPMPLHAKEQDPDKLATDRIDTLKRLELHGKVYNGYTYTLLHLNHFEKDVQWIALLQNNEVVDSVGLPGQPDVNGFSLDKIATTDDGFQLHVEYGSRYYFSKLFHFAYKNGQFYLRRIDVSTFDKANPEAYKNYIEEIESPVRIDDFEILNYLTN